MTQAMTTTSRRPSISGSQFSGNRHLTGASIPSLLSQQQQQQQQQQSHPPSAKATISHSNHASVNSSNPALLNTELRAQARKEREATRERSKEKLQQSSMTTSAGLSIHAGGFHGRERSSSVVSVQQNADKRISPPKGLPKMITNRTTVSRHSRKTSAGPIGNENQPPSQQTGSVGGRPPLQPIHSSSQERQDQFIMEDVPSQRQHFGNLASRIPSPPKGDETKSEFDSMQTAYFIKYYYEMVEKCHSWQRYASNMKAKTETLDIENRILKEINEKQDRDIRALEMEVASLKQATMLHEHERRRAESKLSCYSHRLSPSNSASDMSSRYLRQATSKVALQAVESGMDGMSFPSPPTSGHQCRMLENNSHLSVNTGPVPYCSSNLNHRGSDSEEVDQRPPTPTSAISLPQSLQAVLQENSRRYNEESVTANGRFSRNGHRRNDSNVGDIVGLDAANREAGAGSSYENELFFSRTEGDIQRIKYPANITASNTFPPAEVTASSALTIQALAAMNRPTVEHILPSSISVPQLPSQVWDRPISPGRVAKRQISAGEAVLTSTKRRDTQEPFDEYESDGECADGSNIKHLNLPKGSAMGSGHLSAGSEGRASSTGYEEDKDSRGNSITRGGSALSDALTVTGDYLQDIVEQKRRLRKVSLSQQQQLHYLQARIHLNSNASQVSLSNGANGGSRSSSRMSNNGVRGKARSRAGSYTVHDSIPVAKDDVFSSQGDDGQSNTVPTKRAGSVPLSALDVNNRSGQSDVSDYMSGDGSSFVKAASAKLEEASLLQKQQQQHLQSHPHHPQQQQQVEGNQSGASMPDTDPKGAHRRLYIRLRDELETADLVRFERYVHRYDALEIGIDGSRGIINRVRRLLLPDELVRSKANQPEKYRFRKELAREFERIVREDAVPKEGDSSILQEHHSDTNLQVEAE